MQRMPRPEGPSSDVIRRLRDYWLRLRGERPMPAKRDIDPAAVPQLLPHLVMTDVLHDPLRLRYRLIGSYVTSMSGRNPTGRWLDDELYGKRTEDMLWAFRTCIDGSSPVLVREEVQFTTKEWITIEALLLPIGESNAPINLVLSGVDVAAPGAQIPPKGTSYVLDWRRG
jgi:hypothetical protein